MTFGIPDALSFDRIITGGTCPVSRLPIFYPSNFGLNFTLLYRQDIKAGN
jgi:hypothetical protein